jgi:hypothetical protein
MTHPPEIAVSDEEEEKTLAAALTQQFGHLMPELVDPGPPPPNRKMKRAWARMDRARRREEARKRAS